MRRLREEYATRRIKVRGMERLLFALWGWAALRPWAYSLLNRAASLTLRAFGGKAGVARSLPGAKGWFGTRDMRVPPGGTFMHSRK